MSELTEKMVNDIKIDIPNTTRNTIERYFDQMSRDFFFTTKRHRQTNSYNLETLIRSPEMDFQSNRLYLKAIDKTYEYYLEDYSATATTAGRSIIKVNIETKEVTYTPYTSAYITSGLEYTRAPNDKLYVYDFAVNDDFTYIIFFEHHQFNENARNYLERGNLFSTVALEAFSNSDNSYVGRFRQTDVQKVVANNKYVVLVYSSSDRIWYNPKLRVLSADNLEQHSFLRLNQYDIYDLLITNDDRIFIYTRDQKIHIFKITNTGTEFISTFDKTVKTYSFIYYNDTIYGRAAEFDANKKNIAVDIRHGLRPISHHQIVQMENVCYINPDNNKKVIISNTKDQFRYDLQNKETLTYYQPTSREIVFSHKVRGDYELNFSICPTSHKHIPDYIMETYWDGLKSGILSLLYMLPQGWQSTELAVYHKQMYDQMKKMAMEHYAENIDTFRPTFSPSNESQDDVEIVYE